MARVVIELGSCSCFLRWGTGGQSEDAGNGEREGRTAVYIRSRVQGFQRNWPLRSPPFPGGDGGSLRVLIGGDKAEFQFACW